MTKRQIERVSRGRTLTPEEADRYRQLRADIERDKPMINAEIHHQLAEQRELSRVFAELKDCRHALGLSLENIQERSGIEVSELAKLEDGHPTNLTLDMIRSYAQAVGKRILVTVADPPESVGAGR